VSKKGKHNTDSQDCLLINDKVINNYADSFNINLDRICVADGVGGVPGGYEAAYYVLSHFPKNNEYNSGEELKKGMMELNESLISYAKTLNEKKAMATTLTGLVTIGKEVWLVHAGNTRLYAFIDDELIQVTTDHTNFQALKNDGALDCPDEMAGKNVIYCCFGTGKKEYLNSIVVEKLSLKEPPLYMILTSDGIHDYVDNLTMTSICKENLDDKNKILELMKVACENGSEDDQTIIIARRKLI